LETLRKAVKRVEGGEDVVLVSVAAVEGSAPPRVGFKMAVFADGIEGTVGGGALEKEAVRIARELFAERGASKLVRIDLAAFDMTCGGAVTLFFEPFCAAHDLWIFGGGHIGAALAPMAAAAGFKVTVADDRSEFAKAARFEKASRTICMPYGEAVKMVPDSAFVVIVTHGHAHDEEILNAMVRKTPRLPYIGMIGSSRKIAVVMETIRAAGIDIGPNVYAPIGLDLGGDSPGEIALAIAAQLLGIRHGKPGLPHYRDHRLFAAV